MADLLRHALAVHRNLVDFRDSLAPTVVAPRTWQCVEDLLAAIVGEFDAMHKLQVKPLKRKSYYCTMELYVNTFGFVCH